MKINIEEFNKICDIGEDYLAEFNEAIKNPREAQINFLKKQLVENANTEYGQKYNFDKITSFEEYKNTVPITEYSDYQNYIDRMIHNHEKNLLCAYPIIHYATSSGSTGNPKRIPCSVKNIELFSAFGGNAIFAYLKRQIELQNKKIGPVCILSDLSWKNISKDETLGSISSHITYNFKDIADKLVTSPVVLQHPSESIVDAIYLKALFALSEENLCMLYATFSSAIYEFFHFIELNWQDLVNTIRTGAIKTNLNISKKVYDEISKSFKANPQRADFLEKEFSKGFKEPFVSRIWQNLSMICCIGGSFFALYTTKLYKYAGNIPMHMNAYGASESMMAIPVDLNTPEYFPLISHVFFEFLEVGNDDYSKTLLIDELEDGREYEIIITNMSGFYRYRMLDVIHIEGHKNGMPYGHIVYRLNQVMSIVGEKSTTEQIEYVVNKFSEHIGAPISEYSISPDYLATPSRYVLVIEPEIDMGKGDKPQYDTIVDEFFQKANVSYEKYRHQGTLGEVKVVFVEPMTYALYKDMRIAMGTSPNQIKPVRIIDTEATVKFFFGLSEGPAKVAEMAIGYYNLLLEYTNELEVENTILKEKIKKLSKD